MPADKTQCRTDGEIAEQLRSDFAEFGQRFTTFTDARDAISHYTARHPMATAKKVRAAMDRKGHVLSDTEFAQVCREFGVPRRKVDPDLRSARARRARYFDNLYYFAGDVFHTFKEEARSKEFAAEAALNLLVAAGSAESAVNILEHVIALAKSHIYKLSAGAECLESVAD